MPYFHTQQCSDTSTDNTETVKPEIAKALGIGEGAILEAINQLGAKMTAAMQAASLGAAMMQAPAGDTLESVMAQIIQPTAPTK